MLAHLGQGSQAIQQFVDVGQVDQDAGVAFGVNVAGAHAAASSRGTYGSPVRVVKHLDLLAVRCFEHFLASAYGALLWLTCSFERS
ncbi:hypothetical protein GCM10009733_020240 [Nonomuraea maheshkhaliensis]|uniref:Uncharacterized protein n=1 Tax=Nonomuraea maheshkhaliensis TaxID=419590 RepID=A0ABP4R024_9ACTN